MRWRWRSTLAPAERSCVDRVNRRGITLASTGRMVGRQAATAPVDSSRKVNRAVLLFSHVRSLEPATAMSVLTR